MESDRPILVHQMGKVGSRSVVDSLEATLPDARIEHLHTVTEEGLAAVRWSCEKHGRPLPEHVATGEQVRRDVIDAGIEADVITLVREPMGRNVSAFFQNAVPDAPDLSDEQVDELCRTFVEQYAHTQPLQWFHREFDGVYGLTMHKQPFDSTRGARAYTPGRFRVLVMKCELPDERKIEEIESFLGIPKLTWVRSNETRIKRKRNVYARFKERLRVPVYLLDQLYISQYTRHFYTPDEVARFRAKWTPAPAPDAASAG